MLVGTVIINYSQLKTRYMPATKKSPIVKKNAPSSKGPATKKTALKNANATAKNADSNPASKNGITSPSAKNRSAAQNTKTASATNGRMGGESANAKNVDGNSSRKATTANTKKLSDKDMLFNFFVDELKDIYWAEKHLVKVLTKMEKSATATVLKQAFAGHRKETEGQRSAWNKYSVC